MSIRSEKPYNQGLRRVVDQFASDKSLANAKNPSKLEGDVFARAAADRTTCALAGNLQIGQRGQLTNLRWIRASHFGGTVTSIDAVSGFVRARRFKWTCGGPERNELVRSRQRAFVGLAAANAR
jgi:hypothetical protein